MKDFGQIEFRELKILLLNNNNISNVKLLENIKLEKLELIDLGNIIQIILEYLLSNITQKFVKKNYNYLFK